MRNFVRHRAGDRGEYCRLRQVHRPLSHHIEPIAARQNGGGFDPSNFALACHRCNLHKGPNLSRADPLTGNVELLFHPRRDFWNDPFSKFIILPSRGFDFGILILYDQHLLLQKSLPLSLGNFSSGSFEDPCGWQSPLPPQSSEVQF
jgi:hypothetical protein